MPTNVIMPQMGESIAEGTLTKWLKKPGDAVKRDEPLFEISTDKVDAEIPSPGAGTLLEILVPEGQTVPINTVVARLAEAGGSSAPPAAPAAGGKDKEDADEVKTSTASGMAAQTAAAPGPVAAPPEDSSKGVRAAAPAEAPWLHWLEHWLAGPVWNGEGLYYLAKGIPQGSPLSPILANCYLHQFDGELRAAGLRFVRYADDFLVVAGGFNELPVDETLISGDLSRPFANGDFPGVHGKRNSIRMHQRVVKDDIGLRQQACGPQGK